jgi:hypothetical protein
MLNLIHLLSNDDFFDWETSDSNLGALEVKLKEFCSQFTTTTRGPPLLAELKRFYIKDEREVTLKLKE